MNEVITVLNELMVILNLSIYTTLEMNTCWFFNEKKNNHFLLTANVWIPIRMVNRKQIWLICSN